ncbi:glutaminyl-peptide cyclotransferase, partial [Candidatus Bathyarchaeota archaeon]|nr:glutaminyl-peptide cyclotransferase [Candidatus Bathyarchaeota archaeon]
VTYEGEEITRINELEYIEGMVYANIWQTDQIAIIDPTTGEVASWIDLTGLREELDTTTGIDVLNGIAYDPETSKIYITGKQWPNLFEIQLIPK